jgi:hypothetical protein
MLLTLAVGAATSGRSADTARVLLSTAAVYGGGVALATLWSAWDHQPIRVAYLLAFALLGVISGALLWPIARAPRPISALRRGDPAGPDPG